MESLLANALTIIGREALRIVLPSWCVACGRDLPWGERTASTCTRCWSALPKIAAPKCTSCALPLPAEGICVECQADPLPLAWCDAWGLYDGTLERVLHALKFSRHDFLDEHLAALLEETLLARGDVAFDAIVPVPMHPTKQRTRGYNQAELLARALGRRIGVGCELLLTKTQERGAQSKLARDERRAHVRKVFAASAAAKGRSLLLLDDICTTGETLRACARELLRAGATRVCAISVAKAT